MLITTNINSAYYTVVASLTQCLSASERSTKDEGYKTTLIGNRWVPSFSWILNFVFPTSLDYKKFYTNISPINTERILLVVDRGFTNFLEEQKKSKELKLVYDNTSTAKVLRDDTGNYNLRQYPYTSMSENRPVGKIDIRTNYFR
jgi:hypothetical protein